MNFRKKKKSNINILVHNNGRQQLTCGIPTILWQASICCMTKGLEGAAKTILPVFQEESKASMSITSHEVLRGS